MSGLTGWHLLIVLGALVLLFGTKRLPDMARAVGQSARIFKGEMKGAAAEEARSRQQAPEAAPTTDEPAHPDAPAGLPASPEHVVPGRQPASERAHAHPDHHAHRVYPPTA